MKKYILTIIVTIAFIAVGVILCHIGEQFPYVPFDTLSMRCQCKTCGVMFIVLAPIAGMMVRFCQITKEL